MRPALFRPYAFAGALAAVVLAAGVLLAALGGLSTLAPAQSARGVVAFAYADGRIEWSTAGNDDAHVITADALVHLYAEPHTQIAVDARGGRLWYSDSHNAVRSIDLQTLEPQLTLTGFADAALVGCAAVSEKLAGRGGKARTMF